MMRAFVSHLCDRLAGLAIIEADAVLDDARRLIWRHVFTGQSFEAVIRELDASEKAVGAATLLLKEIKARSPLPGILDAASMMHLFSACDALLAEARLTLWTAVHMNDKNTFFGQHFRSWEEEAERYNKPASGKPRH